MSSYNFRTVCNSIALCLVLVAGLANEVGAVTITPLQPWSNYFAANEAKLAYEVAADAVIECRAGWRLKVGTRTLATREVACPVAPDKPGKLTIDVVFPPVEEGIILAVELEVSVFEPTENKSLASSTRTLWLFPSNPFLDRREWLKDFKITLFDPKGSTARIFEKAAIDCKTTKNLDAVAKLTEGMLIVAEGVSFKDYRALPKVMMEAAVAGRPVLCLAPLGGQLPLPGADTPGVPVPERMLWARNDIITEMDKRLDARWWTEEADPVKSVLTLKGESRRVMGDFAAGNQGWPWFEAQFADSKGHLVICGFGVIEHWEAGPTPRFLLSRIFERFSPEVVSLGPNKSRIVR